MKTILLLASSLLCFTSSAEILVYRNAIKATETGGGAAYKLVVSGYTIVDTDAIDFPVVIWAFKSSKTFLTFEPVTYGQEIVGAKLAKSIVLLEGRTWDNNGFNQVDCTILKGKYSNVTGASIGSSTTLWTIPKTLAWLGRTQWESSNHDPMLEETSGTLTLDLTWSKTCNSLGDNQDNAVQRMKNFLFSQGYSEP